MKKLLLILLCFLLLVPAYAQQLKLQNSYIYVYSTTGFEGAEPDKYNGSAENEAYENFHKYDFGEISCLVIGGEITELSGELEADNVSMFYSIDGNKTYTEIVLPLYTGYGVGSDSQWKSEKGTDLNIDELPSGTHPINVYFIATGGEEPQSSVRDPEEGSYQASFTTAETALPITLSDFLAEPVNGAVELSWSTESETENSHFLIYRDDAIIGRVDGAGTVSESQHYCFTDNYAASGNVYTYELADVSFGNVETRHGEVEVELVTGAEYAENFILNAAYPNPFNPRTVISMQCEAGSDAVVTVYNTQGVPVKELINGYVEPGTYEITWDAAGMPSGVYIVKMTAGNVLRSRKIVLLK
jgi:hypothetical protein